MTSRKASQDTQQIKSEMEELQKTILGSTPVSRKHYSEPIIGKDLTWQFEDLLNSLMYCAFWDVYLLNMTVKGDYLNI